MSEVETMRAENERLKSQGHELQLTIASQHTEYRELQELQSKTADSRDIALAENNRLDRLCGELRKVAEQLATALRIAVFEMGRVMTKPCPQQILDALTAYDTLNPQEKPT